MRDLLNYLSQSIMINIVFVERFLTQDNDGHYVVQKNSLLILLFFSRFFTLFEGAGDPQ